MPAMGMMELDAEIEHERVKVDQDSELSDIAAEMEIMELDVEIEYEGANVDQDSDLSELAAEMEVMELEAIEGASTRVSDPDPSSLANNNEGRPQPGGHTKGLPVVISSFLNPGNNSVVLRCKQTRDGCTSLAEKKVSQGPIRQISLTFSPWTHPRKSGRHNSSGEHPPSRRA